MGLFSWECKHCNKSILGPFGLPKHLGWMNEAVALLPPTSSRLNTSVLMGDYDGYGAVAGGSIHENGEPEVYHRKCWEHVGKPMEFTAASEGAADQGHFYNDEDYSNA